MKHSSQGVPSVGTGLNSGRRQGFCLVLFLKAFVCQGPLSQWLSVLKHAGSRTAAFGCVTDVRG